MSSPSRTSSRQLWNSEAGEVPADITDTQGRPLMNFACRLLDVIVALVMALVLAPLILAIVVIIKLESRGPVLFRQERVGRGRRLFNVTKFRTMYHGAEDGVHRDHIVALIASGQPAAK